MFEMTDRVSHRPTSDANLFGGRSLNPLSRLKTLLAFVRHEVWLRNEIAKASALDDHILADTGMSRREIKHAVRGRHSMLERAVRD